MGSRSPQGTPGSLILADTSFLIRALVDGTSEDRALRTWLDRAETITTSSIAWAEFLCGPLDPADRKLASLIVEHRIEFGEDDAFTAARLFNQSGRRRGSLLDCMIAATAIRVDAELATANRAHFRHFEQLGLRIAVY